MNPLEHFEQKGAYAVFRPAGKVSFGEFAGLLSHAVFLCREQQIGKLLIVSTGVTGLEPPGLVERFKLAERIAHEATAAVKIAHVAHPDWVRSGKFSVLVAKNRGLAGNNFETEPEALAWLLGE